MAEIDQINFVQETQSKEREREKREIWKCETIELQEK